MSTGVDPTGQERHPTAQAARLSAACRDLAYRAWRRLAQRCVWQAMLLSPASLGRDALPRDSGCRVDFVEEAALRRAADRGDLELTHAFLDEALARGDRCWGALDGDELVSYGWCTRQPTPIDDDLRLHFAPDLLYLYKGFTHPAHRGRRLLAVGTALALDTYTTAGARAALSLVEVDNRASLRSLTRMGYEAVGRLRAWRPLGGWRLGADPSCNAHQLALSLRGL